MKFLLDPADSVQVYEEAGKANRRESQYEKGLKALASLDHVQQINVIEGKIIKILLLTYHQQLFIFINHIILELNDFQFF